MGLGCVRLLGRMRFTVVKFIMIEAFEGLQVPEDDLLTCCTKHQQSSLVNFYITHSFLVLLQLSSQTPFLTVPYTYQAVIQSNCKQMLTDSCYFINNSCTLFLLFLLNFSINVETLYLLIVSSKKDVLVIDIHAPYGTLNMQKEDTSETWRVAAKRRSSGQPWRVRRAPWQVPANTFMTVDGNI